MPHFTCLDKYNTNKFRSTYDLQQEYVGEVGRSGDRVRGVRSVEETLKFIFQMAQLLQKNNQSSGQANAVGAKALIAFHESQNQAVKAKNEARLNDAVIRLRTWLSRQGAWFAADGSVNWEQTMKQKVYYDTELEQQNATLITIVGNILKTADGKPLDTSKMVTMHSGPGAAIYVMSAQGNLHLHSHSVGHYHHSSLLAGNSVAGAGELRAVNGRITWLSNKSGHYKADYYAMLQVLGMLQARGVRLDFPVTVMPEGKHYSSVEQLITYKQVDDTAVKTIQNDMIQTMAFAKELLNIKPAPPAAPPVPPAKPGAGANPYVKPGAAGNNYGSNYGQQKAGAPGNNYGSNYDQQKGAAAGNNYGSNYGQQKAATAGNNYGSNYDQQKAAPAGNNYGSNYDQQKAAPALSMPQVSLEDIQQYVSYVAYGM
jgi:hypothetical protein